MRDPEALPPFLTVAQVCDLLQVSRSTLLQWRRREIGPQPTRMGPRTLRYQRDEVLAFIRDRDSRERP